MFANQIKIWILTFSNIRGISSRQIYRLALPLLK